jgi:hypothetical protein
MPDTTKNLKNANGNSQGRLPVVVVSPSDLSRKYKKPAYNKPAKTQNVRYQMGYSSKIKVFKGCVNYK